MYLVQHRTLETLWLFNVLCKLLSYTYPWCDLLAVAVTAQGSLNMFRLVSKEQNQHFIT